MSIENSRREIFLKKDGTAPRKAPPKLYDPNKPPGANPPGAKMRQEKAAGEKN